MFYFLKKIVLCILIINCSYGCTALVTKPLPPRAPSLQLTKMMPAKITLPLIAPKTVLRYTAASENPIKSGNIVASVDVQSEKNNKIIKKITCSSPSGKDVRFEPVSTYFILSIKNQSERIYNLKKTFFQIEDDKGNEFPIPSNISTLVAEMKSDINEYYEKYKTGVGYDEVKKKYEQLIDELSENDKIINKHKKNIFGAYKEKFDSYKSLHTINSIFEFFNPFTYVALILSDGKNSLHKDFDHSISPGNIWFDHNKKLNNEKIDMERHVLEDQNRLLLSTRNNIANKCKECQEKIYNSIKKNKKMIFTSGQFDPIPILPSKTKHIIIPITQWNIKDAPKILYCKIYDIVTVTDDASNPIKRDNLSFTFHRVAHNPGR